MEPDRVGAAIFAVFFPRFCRAVVDERFEAEPPSSWRAPWPGSPSGLLGGDPLGWFAAGHRETALARAFRETLGRAGRAMRAGPGSWTWGRLHQIHLRHVLSGRGELGALLDRGGVPVKGDGVTVCNTGYDPNYLAPMGANYRLIADLASNPPGLWAVDAQGQSGHPGSPHYGDQLAEWIGARYHYLSLDRSEVARATVATLRLDPAP